jgi:translation initiation factor IF-2
MGKETGKTEDIRPRPPVVVVLGHVDHGKSSLIEKIKEIKITEKESGGITQHIGAYQVEHASEGSKDLKKITFLDTPGHEAFSAMRSRGSKVADIAILVVAADEGVKPQTKEAITYVKKAGIPMIVAFNKIDKPSVDLDRVRKELDQQGVLVEQWGGKIPVVETSAKTGKGLQELLEMILLVSEMENLTADFSAPAEGVVIESYLDSKSGPIATVLVRDGVLKIGDIISSASITGKVKLLEDFQKKPISEALPSAPCLIVGFGEVPTVGEKIKVFENSEAAQEYVQVEKKKTKEAEVLSAQEGQKILNLILKADVQGSMEAIEGVLKNLPQEKVVLRILKAEAGEVSQEDVMLAQGSKAKIIGFRIKVNPVARISAENKNIPIIVFDVIYDLFQAVRNLMEKYLEPETQRTDLGRIKILEVFRTEKNRQIVGGKAVEGEIKPGGKLEVIRVLEGAEKIVGKGRMISLQKDKKSADRVMKGQECGLLFEGDVKIEEGDVLQSYIEERRKAEL